MVVDIPPLVRNFLQRTNFGRDSNTRREGEEKDPEKRERVRERSELEQTWVDHV